MASYPCICSYAPDLPLSVILFLGYGISVFKALEWGCLLDSLVRAFSPTVGNYQLKKIYFVLFWPFWFFGLIIVPIVAIYAPHGRDFEHGCPAPGESLTSPAVCFPENGFLYQVTNVFAVPDVSLMITGTYLIMTVYWEKRDYWDTPYWSWLPLLWRGFLLFIYIVGQLVLNRVKAWQMAVNLILLAAKVGLLILASGYWTPARLFPVAAPEKRFGQIVCSGWAAAPAEREEEEAADEAAAAAGAK